MKMGVANVTDMIGRVVHCGHELFNDVTDATIIWPLVPHINYRVATVSRKCKRACGQPSKNGKRASTLTQEGNIILWN